MENLINSQRVSIISDPRLGFKGLSLYNGVLLNGSFILQKNTKLSNELYQIDQSNITTWLEEKSEESKLELVILYLDQEDTEFNPLELYISNNKKLFDLEDKLLDEYNVLDTQKDKNHKNFLITFDDKQNLWSLAISDKDENLSSEKEIPIPEWLENPQQFIENLFKDVEVIYLVV